MSKYSVTITSICQALRACGFYICAYKLDQYVFIASRPVYDGIGEVEEEPINTGIVPPECFDFPIVVTAPTVEEAERAFLRRYVENWKKYNLPCVTFDTGEVEE